MCMCILNPVVMLCFLSDKDNICGENQFERDETLVPHPYDCKMFIGCTRDHHFASEQYVSNSTDGKHVFNPEKMTSDFIWNVPCALPHPRKLTT